MIQGLNLFFQNCFKTQIIFKVHIDEGVITANIRTDEDVYHIEPSWRHLPESDQQTMIAYR